MATALDVQAALEERIESLSAEARNRSRTGGNIGQSGTRREFYIAYEDSRYENVGGGLNLGQTRLMTFASYVSFADLQSDFRPALTLHEALIDAIDGFRPNVAGVQMPFRVVDDRPVAVRSENGTIFRYRARYEIKVELVPSPSLDGREIDITAFQIGIWRSPIGEVGNAAVSTLDRTLNIPVDEDS